MVFSSVSFLFFFLPIVITGYFFLPGIKIRNLFLLVMSLCFYTIGEGKSVIIILISVALNYVLGFWVDRSRKVSNYLQIRLAMISAIFINIGVLVYFKYTNFFIDNLKFLKIIDFQSSSNHQIHLPLGISFFTFHALSYIIDIYREKAKPQKDFGKLALYFTFFPQLIAGPIIRYHDVELQLSERTITTQSFVEGIRRFIIGLGKKVLIANVLGTPAEQIFAIPPEQLTTSLSWLGIICYTLQIYFDFSGYSDMAIGLARMFGFQFLENFNYPYISQSIKEFWRRWHISLSNWFRDYLYIPLGGNRCSPLRMYLNLLLVFFLCGFWHGASWNFIIWGLFHGVFLILERVSLLRNFIESKLSILKHTYALLVVTIGWVFFRSDSVIHALLFIKSMTGFAQGDGIEYHLSLYSNVEVITAIILGIFGSTPLMPKISDLQKHYNLNHQTNMAIVTNIVFSFLRELLLSAIFSLSLIKLAAGTYNPFIYFQF
jgi:alginate O-acetyltransferase complex protein AlgI